jgi:hypothetical protein
MSKITNEWGVLKRQFDALAHDEDVDAISIDAIFDFEFRRRFAELLVETARRNTASHYNWPRR